MKSRDWQPDRPPRLAEWLLEHCLPQDGKGASMRGDLHEEFNQRQDFRRLRFWAATLELCAFSWTIRRGARKTSHRSAKEFHTVTQDFGYSLRTLFKNPGFTAVAVLTLGLGIGANAMIFSVVNAVILRALPYPDPARLVRIWPEDALSMQVVAALNEQVESFQACAGSTGIRVALTGTDVPEELFGAAVTSSHFPVIGAKPLQGRLFSEQDSKPGAAPVVILSHGLWQRRFGGDAGIVGRTIQLGSRQPTVIAVMGPDYRPLDPGWEFWTPLIADPASPVYAGRTWLNTIGRLAGDAELRQAAAEVRLVADGVVRSDPTTYSPQWAERAQVVPLQISLVGQVEDILWILQAAVGFVFLIACSNLANLLLARGASRRREMAVRSALGANRWQVVRLLLAESLLLGVLGGLTGLLLAAWSVSAFAGSYPSSFPLAERIAIDWRVTAFTLAFSVLAAALFGLGPALRASWAALRTPLTEGRDAAGGSLGQRRWSGALVTAQVAFSLVLLTGAGLMLKSLAKLQSVDPGFEAERVLSMRLNPRYERYSGGDRISAFYRSIIERVEGLAGVSSAGAIHLLPMNSDAFNFTYVAQGNPIAPGSPKPTASVRLIMPGYFRSMGIPLLQGRSIEHSDGAEGPEVGVINRALAQKLWPDEDPLGKEIRFFGPQEPPFIVVGVVGDVRQFGLETASVPEIYRPLSQYPWNILYLTLRTVDDPVQLIPQVRQAVWSIDKDVAISQAQPMAQVVKGSISDSRFYTLLITFFAALALSLGSLGVYGVMAYAVNRRRQEIGIRMALGAASRQLLRSTLLAGLRPVVLGLLIGIPAAGTATRVLSASLYQVTPLDPAVFLVVALLLLAVASAAIYLPARKASQVDPMAVLRNP